MKKATIILGMVITAALITVSSFAEKENTCQIIESIRWHKLFDLEKDSLSSSKEVNFGVHKKENMAVSKEKLSSAKSLADFILGYPINWIKNYESVTITAINKGIEKTISGNSLKLNKEQRKLLQNADWASSIAVKVKYIAENEITKEKETREMNVSMSIIPTEPAAFVGGNNSLLTYFKEKSIGQIDISKIDSIEIQQQSLVKIPGFVEVLFTINEFGKAESVKLIISSNIEETDKFILEMVKQMPNWKPAKDRKGNKVKQQFELSVGGPFIGC